MKIMKRNIFLVSILVLAFVSCQVDKKDYTSFVKDAAGYHVISDGEVNLDNQFPPYDELEIYSGDFDVRNALVRLLSDAVTNLRERVRQ